MKKDKRIGAKHMVGNKNMLGKKRSIGTKCFACKFFYHKKFDEIGRRAYAFRCATVFTSAIGHCSFHDCDDATGNGICESFEVADDA